jgi:hypothetical protein
MHSVYLSELGYRKRLPYVSSLIFDPLLEPVKCAIASVTINSSVKRVAGIFTEHSSVPFVMFFLAEYDSIISMSSLFSILFLHVWRMQSLIVIMNIDFKTTVCQS